MAKIELVDIPSDLDTPNERIDDFGRIYFGGSNFIRTNLRNISK